MKRFKKCKVIVFSNELPDKKKLTADRWNIIDLNPGSKVEIEIPTVSLNINEKPKEESPFSNMKKRKTPCKKKKVPANKTKKFIEWKAKFRKANFPNKRENNLELT